MKADILMVPDAPPDRAVIEVTEATAGTVITAVIVVLRRGRQTTERALAITKLQEAGYWLVQDETSAG